MHSRSMFAFLTICLVAGGCGDTAEAKKAKLEIEQAWKAVQDWSQSEWDGFVGDANQRLTDLRAKLDKLEKEAEKKGGEAKKKLDQLRASLDEKLRAANTKLDELKGRSKDAWQEAARGAGSALHELGQGLDRAMKAIEGDG